MESKTKETGHFMILMADFKVLHYCPNDREIAYCQVDDNRTFHQVQLHCCTYMYGTKSLRNLSRWVVTRLGVSDFDNSHDLTCIVVHVKNNGKVCARFHEKKKSPPMIFKITRRHLLVNGRKLQAFVCLGHNHTSSVFFI